MNFVEIAGNLGADPEERFTTTGKRVVSLRVATKSRQAGKEVTIWWRANIWSDRFDKMLPYLKKGSAIIILGEMSKPEIYTDKEGKPQVSLTITAEIVRFNPFGSGKEKQEGGFEERGSRKEVADSREENAFAGATHGDESGFTSDDLPF